MLYFLAKKKEKSERSTR